MAKIKIIKNDTVLVTAGNSKGQKGKVIKVYPKDNRAVVEGVNMISKHTIKTYYCNYIKIFCIIT